MISYVGILAWFGHYYGQMHTSESTTVLERQLLLQLGDRLKRLRQSQGLGTVEMARRAGISRTTLGSVESGDPGPASFWIFSVSPCAPSRRQAKV
jgi:DNA-binding XRE family transcriptional regulator